VATRATIGAAGRPPATRRPEMLPTGPAAYEYCDPQVVHHLSLDARTSHTKL
jgi:hypothetical protein